MNIKKIIKSLLAQTADAKEETMPTGIYRYFYECENCKTVLKPK